MVGAGSGEGEELKELLQETGREGGKGAQLGIAFSFTSTSAVSGEKWN